MFKFIDWVFQLFRHREGKESSPFALGEVIPQHIAMIMDGNGRWAQKRGLPRIAGHRMGAETVRRMVRACAQFGVKYLTLYAFSTENWRRPREEVNFLLNLLAETIDREVKELNQNNVRLRFLGRTAELPQKVRQKIAEGEEKLKKNTGLNLQIMINYGGRGELVDAFKRIGKDIRQGKIKEDKISEELITKYLYTEEIPDPDLLIRTAGEMRVSNFLLWQIAYAEIWVTLTLWPDFGRSHLIAAIRDYQKRERRFGGVIS